MANIHHLIEAHYIFTVLVSMSWPISVYVVSM